MGSQRIQRFQTFEQIPKANRNPEDPGNLGRGLGEEHRIHAEPGKGALGEFLVDIDAGKVMEQRAQALTQFGYAIGYGHDGLVGGDGQAVGSRQRRGLLRSTLRRIDPVALAFKGIGRQMQASARRLFMTKHAGPVRGHPRLPERAERLEQGHVGRGVVAWAGLARHGRQRRTGAALLTDRSRELAARAAFDKHRLELSLRGFDRGGEAHRLAHLARPVIGGAHILVRQQRAGQRRYDRPACRGPSDRGDRRFQGRHGRGHGTAVECMRCGQPGVAYTGVIESLGEHVDRAVRARNHAQFRGIDRADLDRVVKVCIESISGCMHRQHGARCLLRHQPRTGGNQLAGIGFTEYAGEHGRGEFAHAMAQQHIGLHPPGPPLISQCQLYRKDRRLGRGRIVQPLCCGFERRGVGRDQGSDIEPERLFQTAGKPVHAVAEYAGRFVQRAAHARVLRALPRKDERHGRRVGLGGGLVRTASRGTGQRLCRLGNGRGHDRNTMTHCRAPDGQCPGHIGEHGVGMLLKPFRQRGAAGGQRRGRTRGEHQQLRFTYRCVADCPRRGFGHDDVGVGAAHAEGRHPGNTRTLGLRGPRRELFDHLERGRCKIDTRIGPFVVKGRGQTALADCMYRFYQPGKAGRGIQVADVGLDRAQPYRRALGAAAAPGHGQPFYFDGVAQRRTRAVGLDIADLVGADPGGALGRMNHRRLAGRAGRSETHLGCAVVVDRAAADHGQNLAAIGHGIFVALEHHRAQAAGEDRATGTLVEGAYMPVQRRHTAFLGEIALRLRQADGHAARDGQT